MTYPSPLLALCLGATLVHAGVDELRITEVNPVADTVEVTHFDSGFFTNSAQRAFCHRFSYSVRIQVGEVFGPGESKFYSVPLNDTVSDIWLYRGTGGFATAANMISGIKYGSSAAVGRETVAVNAGLWPSASAFLPAPEANESLQLRDEDGTQLENWVSAHPTPVEFFVLTDVVADIPDGEVTVGLREVASGLVSPLGIQSAGDGSGRLFILDQVGRVRILQDGSLLPTPFLDVSAQMVSLSPGYDERGLLGLAFHPGFATNGLLYTYQSEPVSGTPDFIAPGPQQHHSVVAEWEVSSGNPDVVNPGSKRELMRINQPQSNHNGGDLAFGPDGLLYIALGDGGGADDDASGHGTTGNGQDASTVLGAILRIDVEGTNSANGAYGIPTNNPFVASAELDEIFAYGFRNPYRFSFDRATGELYTGDVGQNRVEEVDLVTAGNNYGWRLKEGTVFFDRNEFGARFITSVPVEPIPPGGVVDPIAEYDHDDGISVIGGHVYRGRAIPQLIGRYVFGEFGAIPGSPSGFLMALDASNRIGRLQVGADDRALGIWIKGFGQDDDGEVYVCGSETLGPSGTSGRVLKLIPLVGIDDASVAGFELTVDVVSDSSIGGLEVQSTGDLTDTSSWTNAGGTLVPIGPGLDRATLPAPGPDAAAYRAVGSD